MRKIEKRSIFCLILAALLGLGLAFFCFRLSWTAATGPPTRTTVISITTPVS
ncbi:MAG: hypothetical protein V8Q23_03150 [Eubacteriales bacterium]